MFLLLRLHGPIGSGQWTCRTQGPQSPVVIRTLSMWDPRTSGCTHEKPIGSFKSQRAYGQLRGCAGKNNECFSRSHHDHHSRTLKWSDRIRGHTTTRATGDGNNSLQKVIPGDRKELDSKQLLGSRSNYSPQKVILGARKDLNITMTALNPR